MLSRNTSCMINKMSNDGRNKFFMNKLFTVYPIKFYATISIA